MTPVKRIDDHTKAIVLIDTVHNRYDVTGTLVIYRLRTKNKKTFRSVFNCVLQLNDIMCMHTYTYVYVYFYFTKEKRAYVSREFTSINKLYCVRIGKSFGKFCVPASIVRRLGRVHDVICIYLHRSPVDIALRIQRTCYMPAVCSGGTAPDRGGYWIIQRNYGAGYSYSRLPNIDHGRERENKKTTWAVQERGSAKKKCRLKPSQHASKCFEIRFLKSRDKRQDESRR